MNTLEPFGEMSTDQALSRLAKRLASWAMVLVGAAASGAVATAASSKIME